MSAILPWAVLLLLVALFAARGFDMRTAALAAAVAWGALVAVVTELLGYFVLLTPACLAAAWAVAFSALVWPAMRALRSKRPWFPLPRPRPERPGLERVVAWLAAATALALAVVALRSPPHTWDCMSYHMSRVCHWLQNGTVAFYPTHILRQNHQAPWAEFAVLNLQALSGGDRFANLVQWFAMFGCMAGVSSIARELTASERAPSSESGRGRSGEGRGAEFLAAVVCLTIPMGILQATSAKNDYVVAFWLVCAVVFLARAARSPSAANAALAGAALGLACLTKGTAYVYALPFVAAAAAAGLYRHRVRWLKAIVVLGAVALMLNMPHYIRNTRLYGRPLGPGREGGAAYSYLNQHFTLPILGANIVRNLGLHVGTRWDGVNARMEKCAYALLGPEVDNPASTWGGVTFRILKPTLHEESAGNGGHLLLGLLAGAVLLSRPGTRIQRIYVLLVLAAAVLFCACLRWQPWHSRLHLPLFVLASPIAAVGAAAILRTRHAVAGFGAVLLLASAPLVLGNPARPLLGRDGIWSRPRLDLYFVHRPRLRDPYVAAADHVKAAGVRDIGLIVDGDDYEYAWWVLLGDPCGGGRRLEHVAVANVSAAAPMKPFDPDAIIATVPLPDTIAVNGASYGKTFESDPVRVFRRLSGPDSGSP